MNTSRVPPEILSGSKEQKYLFFRDSHPIIHIEIKNAYEAIRKAIERYRGDRILMVFGPTGVGKSTLYRKLLAALTNDLLSTVVSDPGRIPVIGITAPAQGAYWNWQEYNVRLLLALNESWELLRHKKDSLQTPDQLSYAKIRRRSSWELSLSVERSLNERKPVAVLIDEAQHMTRVGSGTSHEFTLDKIKSIANLTGILHVLFGTYELLHFRNLSPQLGRRCSDIHFRRYVLFDERGKCNTKQFEHFLTIIRSFEARLPFGKPSNLIRHWKFLYSRSVGCVGMLKELLDDALWLTLEKGRETISIDMLKQAAKDPSRCNKIDSDAREGEKALRDDPNAESLLLCSLGLHKSTLVDAGAKKKSARKGIVGRPNPRRYRTGGSVV